MLKKKILISLACFFLSQQGIQATYEDDKIIKGFQTSIYDRYRIYYLQVEDYLNDFKPSFHYLTLSYNFSLAAITRKTDVCLSMSFSVDGRNFKFAQNVINSILNDTKEKKKLFTVNAHHNDNNEKHEYIDNYAYKIKAKDNKIVLVDKGNDNLWLCDDKDYLFLKDSVIYYKVNKNYLPLDEFYKKPQDFTVINRCFHGAYVRLFTLSAGLCLAHKIHKGLYLTLGIYPFISLHIPKLSPTKLLYDGIKRKKHIEGEKHLFEVTEKYDKDHSGIKNTFFGILISIDFKFHLFGFIYMHFSPIKYEIFRKKNTDRDWAIKGEGWNHAIHILSFGLYF